MIRHRRRPHRKGFTLLEAMMASGILLMTVVAVTSAVTAGQQHAFEARQQVAAGMAAQDLMGRLRTVRYADLPDWHGYTEGVGAMTDLAGDPMPETFAALGREVRVTTVLEPLPPLDVRVRGREVQVKVRDRSGRIVTRLKEFVPEPQS